MFNEQLQKVLVILGVILSVFVGVKALNEVQTGRYIGRAAQETSTITVSGTGESFVKPDIANITTTITKKAQTVVDAQKQNTDASNKVIKFLKDSGVAEKDIKTVGYNIYPEYDYLENTGRVFRGYTVTQSLQIKIRKIDDAGKIVAGVTENGANDVSGLTFTTDDEDAGKREARQEAIEKAKAKAEKLADDLDIDLIRLVTFSESGGQYYDYARYDSKALSSGGGEIAPAPEIQPGENKITTTVSLTYEIR